MSSQLLRLEGVIRGYDWGSRGGISRALGDDATDAVEAELWLGAHPSAPARIIPASVGPSDLAEWERQTGQSIPFLLKLLSARSPLSLQAHPTTEQAAAGYAAEEAAGITRSARERNYKDPFAKPELIVALEDGFEALCGFREAAETLATVRHLAEVSPDPAPIREWEHILRGNDAVRSAFSWLLGGGRAIDRLLTTLTLAAAADPLRFELPNRIAHQYPGDVGIAICLMLNHVVLAAGEALWLPAGNIHAYLSGTGMELMGPSDNVLRGGMTSKHVDLPELLRVLDFSTGPSSKLVPERRSDHAVEYRPASVPTGQNVRFALVKVDGDVVVPTEGPAVGLVTRGEFFVSAGAVAGTFIRGSAFIVAGTKAIDVQGEGDLYLAVS
ncbi:mannose-6-phosphate isomerase, class I [Microbacterium invictum]|uniref:mannose-6-phosphate isomerase n=1 Tax=Microbacterium invictum TaxID=515415 RepID=A0ABZ0VB52_9MICO|nr:mannose-6-phosphate isomerase, class I [Microbacterium invictum]WQB70709.1 mannose-6-phosphate isomerase, class I [Microbacterium invictum]